MNSSIRETVVKTLDEALNDYKALSTSTGWEYIDQIDEVIGHKKFENSKFFIKGEGIIKAPAQVVADFLWNEKKSKEFNQDLLEIEILDEFEDTKVLYELNKSPWPVSDRDLVRALRRIKEDQDFLIFGRSVKIGVAERTNVVRAETFIKAFYMKNIKNIATRITYYNSGDPKGDIPAFIASQASKKQAFFINLFKNLIKR